MIRQQIEVRQVTAELNSLKIRTLDGLSGALELL